MPENKIVLSFYNSSGTEFRIVFLAKSGCYFLERKTLDAMNESAWVPISMESACTELVYNLGYSAQNKKLKIY